MKNAVSWFELPVYDLERATTFYSQILRISLSDMMEADDRLFAMFPVEAGVTGALVRGDGYRPSTEGALVFLNAGDELQPVVERVEEAGGRVISPHFDMGEWGVAAFIIDSEGNKVALHAQG
jgi:uncharacterized protein